MESEQNSNKKIIASFVAVLAIVVVAVGITFATHKDKAETGAASMALTSQNNKTDSTSSQSSSSSASAATYKDGSYSATGNYMTPGGQESVTVSVTLKDSVITGTSLEQHANNSDTENYQSQFASGYKEKVVGKSLDGIKLSRVSGSSLTSQGFNNAIETIKDQAKQQS